jgi:hypothetical protein
VRRVLRFGLGALALVLALAAVGLALAHREIRARDPALPSDAEVLALAEATGGPTAIAWHETASQGVPRSQVLDREQDASPDEPYVMAHSMFALAWPDGRLLLVDLGMEHEAAVAFSRPLRWVGGGIPITFGGPAEALGPAVSRVAGVIFSHLHTDHVEGALGLCAARSGAALPVFQTAAQAELANFTTRPGRSLLERAGCLSSRRLSGAPLAPVPGFPGVGVADAAGSPSPGTWRTTWPASGRTWASRSSIASSSFPSPSRASRASGAGSGTSSTTSASSCWWRMTRRSWRRSG